MKKFFLISVVTILTVACNTNNNQNTTMEVIINTNKGDITLSLYQKEAKNTVENFLQYVDAQYYNDTIFHRVIDNFMVQGGGFEKNFVEKKPLFPPISNEADNGLKNKRGTIAMARTSAPHSAQAQFFINVKDNNSLDYQSKTSQGWGYAVFGEVIDGMEIVNEIKTVKTASYNGHNDVPTTEVIIYFIHRK